MSDHGVQAVEIKGPKVKVVCHCGKKTAAKPSESAAMKEHEKHLAEVKS